MTTNNLFTVLYSFKVPKEEADEFIQVWSELTQLIYEYEGSYGSRLHRASPGHFIGYAQWPSKEVWKNSGNHLPDSATALKKRMRELCSEIKTEFEMDVVQDRLKTEPYSN